MGVEVGAGVVGDHDQLVHAAGENALLQLGVVGLRVGDRHADDFRVRVGGGELHGGLDGVQVVRGHDAMGFRVVQTPVGGYDDVLIVGQHLDRNNDVHGCLSFLLLSSCGMDMPGKLLACRSERKPKSKDPVLR